MSLGYTGCDIHELSKHFAKKMGHREQSVGAQPLGEILREYLVSLYKDAQIG